MSQPDSSKRSKRTIYRKQPQHGALWRLVTQLITAARFLCARKRWGWVFAALLMLVIHAPARANGPCSGGADSEARPIAATLQPNASAFNPDGRFEVKIQSNVDLTTDIYVRHSVGSRELFRAVTRLQSELHAAVLGHLPASEGLGFSLEVEEGGSGYRQVCTYGFRFQHGVVSYRTLAARAETRGGGVFAGAVTDWKSVLTQAQLTPSPPTAAANPATVTDTTPIEANGRPGYGDVIGEFRGVVARSNGDCTATLLLDKCGNDNTWKQYAYYQCVDYAKRFYQKHYRTVSETQSEWKDAFSFWSRTTHPNLLKYLNGKTNILPKPGDMLFFDTGHPEGHVAIVISVSAGKINIIQQNIKRETAYAEVNYKTEPNGLIRLADGMLFPDGSLSTRTMKPLGWLSLRENDRSNQSPSASLPGEFPPMPFIDYGYQVDLVTGDWHLRRVHTLFADIGDQPRAIGTLNTGETVMADQIAIRTFNYEIYEVSEPMVGKFWNHVTQQGVLEIVDTPVALKKGDRIVVLSYFGEGECRVWFKGKTYVAECPPITGAVDNQLTKRKSEIWARVVTNKGLRGYLRDPDALGMSKHD